MKCMYIYIVMVRREDFGAHDVDSCFFNNPREHIGAKWHQLWGQKGSKVVQNRFLEISSQTKKTVTYKKKWHLSGWKLYG